MNITVRVIVDPGDGSPFTSHDVATLTRDDLTAATAGLRLAEAHQIVSASSNTWSMPRPPPPLPTPSGAPAADGGWRTRTAGPSCCAACSARCASPAHG